MKTFGRLKNMFLWISLVAGFFWFLQNPAELPSAQAMSVSHSGMSTMGKMNPMTCPMKGALPCCRQNGVNALFCLAPHCDLCLVTPSGLSESPVESLRVLPPGSQVMILTISPGTQEKSAPRPYAPFPPRYSFAPPVNTPLLI